MRKIDAEFAQAREVLREKIRAARDEGVPFTLIARRVELSRERVRELYAGRLEIISRRPARPGGQVFISK